MSEREAYIGGLRELAKFYEDNPEFPLAGPVESYVFPEADDQGEKHADFARLARLLGKSQKSVTDMFFSLKRSFGPHGLEVTDYRDKVCTPRVVGQKVEVVREPVRWAETEKTVDIVEWDCPSSILAGHRG